MDDSGQIGEFFNRGEGRRVADVWDCIYEFFAETAEDLGVVEDMKTREGEGRFTRLDARTHEAGGFLLDAGNRQLFGG